jgi:hypothetical protein
MRAAESWFRLASWTIPISREPSSLAVEIAPLTRSEYRAALKVRDHTRRDRDYVVAEGEPTPKAVATPRGSHRESRHGHR